MKKITDKLEWLLDLGGTKKDVALLIISGISLIISLAFPSLPFDAAWVSVVLCGVPIVLEAIIGLITAFDIKADVLVSMALIASLCTGEFFAAGEVAFIMQIGGLLEQLTAAKARSEIEKLVQLTPQTARILTENGEKIIPAEEVKVGDTLRVLAGETIAVDGTITSGASSINQAVVTGEGIPVDKTVGDEVFSGTTNLFGAFEMRAEKVGENGTIQRMIRLVQSADAGKAKIVGLADKWATWIVVIALTAAIITWAVTGEIIRAVTILVVFCPCALVLATPTAIMAAIGSATKRGFLIREGGALERLAKADTICFDKTGTLTLGEPSVIAVKSFSDYSSEEIFAYAAAAEQLSEHPLGKAIVKSYKEQNCAELSAAQDFSLKVGHGVSAVIDGRRVLAGNALFIKESLSESIESKQAEAAEYTKKGCTIIYVSIDGTAAGFIALSDELRGESADVISRIKSAQAKPVLLTGDSENAANNIGTQLGISEIKSECLPENKLDYIKQQQESGASVCMIGDGINDAPALKAANVGIAMGGIGSDIAVDAADIVLVGDNIKDLPFLLRLSRKMMRVIKLNLTFSMTLNFVSIILAMTGVLNPVIGALVHNAGSVAVIINSALLLWSKSEG